MSCWVSSRAFLGLSGDELLHYNLLRDTPVQAPRQAAVERRGSSFLGFFSRKGRYTGSPGSWLALARLARVWGVQKVKERRGSDAGRSVFCLSAAPLSLSAPGRWKGGLAGSRCSCRLRACRWGELLL
ncbi:hypothetical protein MHYP_G00088290 [Metynnis hypsauchen]